MIDLKFAPIFLLAGLILTGCSEQSPDATESVETVAPEVEEAPLAWDHPNACFECHESSKKHWEGSHHALANRRVDLQADKAAFEIEKVLDEGGNEYQLKSDVDALRIVDTSLDGHPISEQANRGIEAVIGHEPIVQYLVPFDGGRLQTHGLTRDVEKGEWYDVFGGDVRTPDNWGHWTQQGMNWNSNCAWCHMTDYNKNFDMRTNSYSSSWKIEGISCIQCHSDMESHVAKARAGEYIEGSSKLSEKAIMENCASCHSRREQLTKDGFHAGEAYEDHFRLMLPDVPGTYFEDGQALEENYVYTSFVLSKMGEKGVTCMDCHDPHLAKPKLSFENNLLCMQCHATGLKDATIIDPLSHSHHAEGSMGNRCVECHMPERIYMGRDARRDHGFTSPNPEMTLLYDVPNACNSCHDDKSPEWANGFVKQWYGESDRKKRIEKRAHAFHGVNTGDTDNWELFLPLYDSETNPYWRSAYLRSMLGGSSDDRVLEAALQSKKSKVPLERDSAVLLLSQRSDRLADVQSALRDPSRTVRLQAAGPLLPMLQGNEMAFQEFVEYSEMNADRPAGALRRAELAIRQNDLYLAKQLAVQAVGMDRENPHLLYDAAIILDRIGDVDTALEYLNRARSIDGTLAYLAYAQGLLYAEKEDLVASINALSEAVRLDPSNDRWWYNLCLAHMRNGEREEARSALEKALELSPQNAEYLQALGGLK